MDITKFDKNFAAATVEKDGKKYVDCSMKNVDVSRKGSYRLCKTKLTLPKEAGV